MLVAGSFRGKLRICEVALLLVGVLVVSSCVAHGESKVLGQETGRDFTQPAHVENLKYELFKTSLPESDTTLAQEIFRSDGMSFWKLEDLKSVCLGVAVSVEPEEATSTSVDLGSGQTLLSKCVNEETFEVDGVLLDAKANELTVAAFMQTIGGSAEAPSNFEEVTQGLFLPRL